MTILTQLELFGSDNTESHPEYAKLEQSILSHDDFKIRTARIVRKAIDYALDGAADFTELEAVEKSIMGIKVEKYWLREFGYPMKMTKEKINRLLKENPNNRVVNTLLDTEVADVPVDLKHTIGDNWMVPPEAFGHWLLLFKTNLDESTCSVGLFKADEALLTKGSNQDKKKNLTAESKKSIRWLVVNQSL